MAVNRIMINQGDGTFRVSDLDSQADFELFCTSLAMGDVTGDSLPDLFVLNYSRDPEITRLPKLDPQGNVVDAVAPLSFQPARDHLYVNQADGIWKKSPVGETQNDAMTGLGIVITDLRSNNPGNEIFVGNDIRRNQFWMRAENQRLTDVAALPRKNENTDFLRLPRVY